MVKKAKAVKPLAKRVTKKVSAAPIPELIADIEMPVSNNIRNWRLFRGITSQSELGTKSGVARATICRLEAGKLDYRQHWLEAIAKALDCSPASLIDTNPYAPASIIAIYERLGPGDKSTVDKLVQHLAHIVPPGE